MMSQTDRESKTPRFRWESAIRLFVTLSFLLVAGVYGMAHSGIWPGFGPKSYQLRWNMTKTEVLNIMGPPCQIETLSPAGTISREGWQYPKEDLPHLVFEGDHLVSLTNRGKGADQHPVNRGSPSSRGNR